MTSHCNNKTLFLIEHGTNIHFIGLQDGDTQDQNRKNETLHTLANDSGSIDLRIWASIYNFVEINDILIRFIKHVMKKF